MNFAFLYFLGLLSYNPGTFVMLINTLLKCFASFAAVESDVCFLEYLKAPQITTLYFFKCSSISFISFGMVLLNLLPKKKIKNFSFLLFKLKKQQLLVFEGV